MPHLRVAGRALAYEWIEPGAARGAPVLVFLHEGLGSIRRWRDFPARVARAAGARALVFDRYGYGDSDPLAEERVGVDYMHREALQALPAILGRLEIDAPVLLGHSDGASIALIHAGAGHPVSGLVLLAPHVFTEPGGLAAIEDARRRFETSDMPQRLAKYHRDPRKTFYLWNDAWLDPDFRRWNIEDCLPRIACPVLAIQGEADEYGTLAQVEAIARRVAGPCALLKLPGCGHSPHRDRPEEVLSSVSRFLEGIMNHGER